MPMQTRVSLIGGEEAEPLLCGPAPLSRGALLAIFPRVYRGTHVLDAHVEIVRGRVVTVERLGAESYLYVDIGQPEVLVVKAGPASRARAGDNVSIGVPSDAAYLFDADGTCLDRQPAEHHGAAA